MQTKPNTHTAVAYIRVSTEDQNLGPEAQRAAIERWSSTNGVRIVAWHEDRLSGAAPADRRPGLLAALGDLRTHNAGLLVAAKRDRIARDVMVAAVVERLVEQAGARVVTSDGVSADQTPEGTLMRTMLDAFAQYERAVIRARTRAALQAKIAKGERVGRPKVPVDQTVLERVRTMRDKGLSLRRIADLLNAEGIKARAGKWHVTTLARVLKAA